MLKSFSSHMTTMALLPCSHASELLMALTSASTVASPIRIVVASVLQRLPANPEAGHDVELVNFTSNTNPYELQLSRFAFNCKGEKKHDPDGTPKCNGESEQAFVSGVRGINRPTTIRFGPDGAAYLVDYGAVRDPGGSDPGSAFHNPDNAPLVQIPGTGTVWKITRDPGRDDNDD